MLSFIKEKETVWQYLKMAGKPIVLYGTGDGADKIMARLSEENISASGIFASDEFVRGQEFSGFTVRKYSELLSIKTPLIVLICFASELPEQMKRFYELEKIHETYAPHVPVFSGDETVTPEWLEKYESQLLEVYNKLEDETSRQVFASVLNYKISGKLCYLRECTTYRQNDLKNIFAFGPAETYADLGAFNGDTIKEFLQLTNRNFNKIYAVEPDAKNFKKLKEFVLRNEISRTTCIQAGIWNRCGALELAGNGGRQSTFCYKKEDESVSSLPEERKSILEAGKHAEGKRKKIKVQTVPVITIDHMLGNDRADYMKFDVEGMEQEGLQGAKDHLRPDCNGILPKLLVAAYHHDTDIFVLPLLLWDLQPRYKIYMRKHPYIPAWEINIFAK